MILVSLLAGGCAALPNVFFIDLLAFLGVVGGEKVFCLLFDTSHLFNYDIIYSINDHCLYVRESSAEFEMT